jgi:hypothetical protein
MLRDDFMRFVLCLQTHQSKMVREDHLPQYQKVNPRICSKLIAWIVISDVFTRCFIVVAGFMRSGLDYRSE